jgi:tetratricopeptide (TPR) repeat protein
MSTVDWISDQITLRRVPALRLSLIVAAVIIALALVDVSLERTEQIELAAQALRANQTGTQLLKQGKASDAVDAFRKAHALERENTKYELDLIQALMAAGKLNEAEPLMKEILEEQSNHGEANLVAARLAAKQGQISSADAYYHRAIYGEWPHEVSEHQVQVRLELIDFLQKHGKRDEILAELLPLEEQVGKDSKLQPIIAHLFLVTGFAVRAQDMYRQMIKADPKDPANYVGLGEAELDLGDFRAARAAFSNAEERNGNDPAIRERLQLAHTLSNLDPTFRWLSAQEKYARSRRILGLATDDLQQCILNHSERATDEANQLVTVAQSELSAPAPKQPTNEMAEGALSLAETIWRARTSVCGTGTASDEEPLRLIMEKLAK